MTTEMLYFIGSLITATVIISLLVFLHSETYSCYSDCKKKIKLKELRNKIHEAFTESNTLITRYDYDFLYKRIDSVTNMIIKFEDKLNDHIQKKDK